MLFSTTCGSRALYKKATTMASTLSKVGFGVTIFLSQLAFIIIFGCLVDYGWDATPVSRRAAQFLSDHHSDHSSKVTSANAANSSNSHHGSSVGDDVKQSRVPEESYYAMFQDVHVMVFIGFGFLMTFLRKYGYGAVGFNFILAAYVLQWASILRGFFRLSHNNWRIRLDIASLIGADFTAATILITLGVVLGKLSTMQYLLMILFETIFVTLNEWIIMDLFFIKDAGGSIAIHLFGALFGLTLARVIHRREWSKEGFNNLKFGTHYTDLFSLLGTLFLWMFWPSFNAALAVEDGKYRAVFNTYMSISASCLGAYMVSSLVSKENKFGLEIIQNATLAGGVVVGSICDLYLYPWGALICGFCAGSISALGFRYLSEILDRIGFHDTCGVNNLHCMPGFLGAILSAIVTACATKEVYGSSYYKQFPAHSPPADDPAYKELLKQFPDLKPGLGWTPSTQGAYQMAAIGVTFALAIGGAIITGLVLRLPFLGQPTIEHVMSDETYWHGPQKCSREEEKRLRERIRAELAAENKDLEGGQNHMSNNITMRTYENGKREH